MVFSSSVSVYADEVKDGPKPSENGEVLPEAGAGAQTPASPETEPGEEQTGAGDETDPGAEEPGAGETVTDPEAQEPVSGGEAAPVEEETALLFEEPAGVETPEETRLIESIKNAVQGATVVLTEDVTLTKCLEIGHGKEITIDLSGNKITGAGSAITELYAKIYEDGVDNHLLLNKFLISVSGDGTKVTLTDSKKTGSISYNEANPEDADSIVAVWDGATLTVQDITLTAYDDKIPGKTDKSAMKAGAKAVMAVGNVSVVADSAAYYARPKTESKVILNDGLNINRSYIGVYAIGSGATLVANDGATVAAVNAAIQNQGEFSFYGTDITVNGGRFVGYGGDGNGIYHPGAGTLNINGGEFLGATAIETSNGITNIRGGKTSVSAEGDFDPNWITTWGYTYSGSTAGGCAVCYSPYARYAGLKSELNIISGDFVGKKGLYISKRNTTTEDNLKNDVKLSVSGGTFTAVEKAVEKAAGFPDGVFEKFLYGGKFSDNPAGTFIADGYRITHKADNYYEVIRPVRAFIRPVLEQGKVFQGQSLSEAGLKVILEDENRSAIEGAAVTKGVSFWNTDQAGTVSGPEVSTSAVLNTPGTYYLGVSRNGDINISRNGIDMTDYYTIVNGSVSVDYLLKYTVEQITEEDKLTIVNKKEVCYSESITDPYEFFEVVFMFRGSRQELKKGSGVKFYWDGSGTPSDSFDCSGMETGTSITVNVKYLDKEASTVFKIQPMPVYVTAAGRVSTLAGAELSERYYGQISVYRSDVSGNQGAPIAEKVRMDEWFDPTSSAIDLTGISNTRPGEYVAELKDLGRLKDDKNYDLQKKPTVVYVVEPSLIIEFMEPDKEEAIAPMKIRRAADNSSLNIYSFTNDRNTNEAIWCIKQVSYNSVDQYWFENMVDISENGIIYSPIADNKGVRFEFKDEFLDKIKDTGARYTFYEVFNEDTVYDDAFNRSITVKAVTPVIYNGNKFVAKDDTRYFNKGIPKNGISPALDVQVWDGKEKKLSFGTDYTLSYKNNKNAGGRDSDNPPFIIVTGLGEYAEMKITVYFTILAADLFHNADVEVTTQYIRYSGNVLKPKFKVTYRSGSNAGKVIPASAYDVSIFDKNKKDVTGKKFAKSEQYAEYTAVITANGKNPNITGSTEGNLLEVDENGNEKSTQLFFYGIPKTSEKMTVGGTYKTVAYPLSEDVEGLDGFLDPARFYAKISNKKFVYKDINDSVSIDIVDSKDECTATVFDPGSDMSSGVYFLRVSLADKGLKNKYYVFEPTYVKVTYAGTKLRPDDITLKKKNFDFSDYGKTTPVTLKISNRILNKGTDDISLYIYQNSGIVELSEIAEDGYVIDGERLENAKVGRYRIRVTGTGPYYGSYDLTYTIGVQAYNKDKTPVAAYVNTGSQDAGDTDENDVPYRSDGNYDDSMVKVVWTVDEENKIVLTRGVDYNIKWGNFKQVGENKGSVTIIGTGTYFTGRFKKRFDVTEAE